MRSFITSKISRQFTAVILASFLLCSALYFVAQPLLDRAICHYYDAHPDINEAATHKALDGLQAYVDAHQVLALDEAALSAWMRQQPLTILHVYRSGGLLYDSTLSTSSGLHTHATGHSSAGQEATQSISFADGPASVSITVFPEYAVVQMVSKVLLLACALLFLAILLLSMRRKLRYLTRLEQEVLSIAGGAVHAGITSHGQDELARLAECIDEMRQTLLFKLEREEARQQESYEWATALSHDLRTPLTMLTGYLEIIRRTCTDTAQAGYIDKAAEKAAQLKGMSDLLFASFSPGAIESGALAPISSNALAKMLAERAQLLGEKGYALDLRKKMDADFYVHPEALVRVLDNVFSNLEKYAAPEAPITVHIHTQSGRLCLYIESQSRQPTCAQSAGLGLGICQNLMANMRGSFATHQHGDTYTYCIDWEIVKSSE